MFNWLKRFLFGHPASQLSAHVGNLPARSFPSPDRISEWDDQALYVATGCESALRYQRDGFQTLNDVEGALCCFYLMESDFNNGGAGQWICDLCPRSAVETPRALRRIGATELADFAEYVLRPLGNPTEIQSKDEWVNHYLSMSDDVHEHWETLTPEYCRREERFLELAYAYARINWRRVRVA
jgi:hypothetical protein